MVAIWECIINWINAHVATLPDSPPIPAEVTVVEQGELYTLIFRGLKRLKGDRYTSTGKLLSKRGVEAFPVEYQGTLVRINPHDLRRTFARLCKKTGMSWEALRENMGHTNVKMTEEYVDHDVDGSDRIPNWTVDIN